MNIIFLSIAYRLSVSLHSIEEVPDSRGTRLVSRETSIHKHNCATLSSCLRLPIIVLRLQFEHGNFTGDLLVIVINLNLILQNNYYSVSID